MRTETTQETTEQYEEREIRGFRAQLSEVDRAPMADRREAQAEWREALKDPELIGQRVHWLIQGNYGYGSYLETRKVLGNLAMNREAWLSQTIAALEWQCPQDKARAEFNALSLEGQGKVKAAVRGAIAFWMEEQKLEAEYQAKRYAEPGR